MGWTGWVRVRPRTSNEEPNQSLHSISINMIMVMVIYTMYTDFAFEPNELIDCELLTDELCRSHLKAARLELIFDLLQPSAGCFLRALEQTLSFDALLLYLCRAAHGSADIPILPHAHTILLKHAVNLKRRGTLFNVRLALSSPFCKCTNRAVTQLLDSPPASPKNSGGPLPRYLPRMCHVTLRSRQ